MDLIKRSAESITESAIQDGIDLLSLDPDSEIFALDPITEDAETDYPDATEGQEDQIESCTKICEDSVQLK